MKEPNASHLWNESFTVSATVFYITEPCTPEALLGICTQVRLLTAKNLRVPSYFLVLFPNAASLLFFSPQKAICNGFANGDLSPALAHARQRITETAVTLIKECC